jgi:hypothetical protein
LISHSPDFSRFSETGGAFDTLITRCCNTKIGWITSTSLNLKVRVGQASGDSRLLTLVRHAGITRSRLRSPHPCTRRS